MNAGHTSALGNTVVLQQPPSAADAVDVAELTARSLQLPGGTAGTYLVFV